MIELWGTMAVLTLIAAAIPFWPLLRRRSAQREAVPAQDRQHQNIEIFRERLAELEQERRAGTLDDASFEVLKTELERNLLIDAETPVAPLQRLPLSGAQLTSIVLLALLIPVAAFGLYSYLGRSADLAMALNPPPPPATLEEAVAQLEQELERNPNNAEGWYLLGTTYMGQERYPEGLAAFKRVAELLPQGAPQYAGVQGQIAQAMYFAANGKMNDEIRAQIDHTLTIDPQEIAALGLLGIDAYESGRYPDAMLYWNKALVGASGEAAQSLKAGIEQARQQALAAGQTLPDLPQPVVAAIDLRVSLAPELQAKASPEQTVFVFARPVGQRMPLAAVRLKVSELPKQIRLDDSQAMMAGRGLSSVSEVEIGALISQSGAAGAQPGDLTGTQSPVPVSGNDQVLELVIDRVVE